MSTRVILYTRGDISSKQATRKQQPASKYAKQTYQRFGKAGDATALEALFGKLRMVRVGNHHGYVLETQIVPE